MENLKELLDINNLHENDIQKLFKDIAKKLMCDYTIEKSGKQYAIVEIEFYLYNHFHKDYIVYPRKIEAGRWFFHPSGVDLSFKSDINNIHTDKNQKVTYSVDNASCFGGILIRGIYHESCGYIFGPQKCVDILWNNLDAFDCNNQSYPVLNKVIRPLLDNIYICKRHINIKEKANQTIKIKDWVKRLGMTITDKEIEQYRKELFESADAMRYRFFNLPNGEEPWNFTNIPSVARPPKIETEKIL